jgi:glycosyltransferase involved in cell wall biosynthesis
MKLHLIVSCYNAGRWIERCLGSVLLQTFSNWKLVVVDDGSVDDTASRVARFCAADSRISLLSRGARQRSHLANQCAGIEESRPDEEDVIVILDGDDWLPDPGALEFLVKRYSETACWMTYGSYQSWRGDDQPLVVEPCSSYSEDVLRQGTFRRDTWRATHLRTFKYWLWLRIDQRRSFYTPEGKMVSCCVDLAVMFPLLEMSRLRALFIRRVLLTYNRLNPSGFEGKPEAQAELGRMSAFLRSLDPYSPVLRN